jgi:hypothetical protein
MESYAVDSSIRRRLLAVRLPGSGGFVRAVGTPEAVAVGGPGKSYKYLLADFRVSNAVTRFRWYRAFRRDMQQVPPDSGLQPTGGVAPAQRFVNDESLVLRNYDGEDSHELVVRFRDADGELAFERTYELGPDEVVATRTRLPRGVYGVTVRRADGAAATRECLIGSGPAETAVVETGNGILSLVEGLA